jgi:Flp pilus assembly protein TadB
VKGPRITVRCDCGSVRHVPYGERWECEDCGRCWNTAQIAPEEYRGIMRDMRRFRLQAVAAALAFCGTFAVLAFTVAQSLALLLPVVLAGWYLLYMPRWRRRLRRRVRSLPTWKLHPE